MCCGSQALSSWVLAYRWCPLLTGRFWSSAARRGPTAGTFAGEQDQGRLDTRAGGALWETRPAADDVYPVGSGAVGSFCHRPNSLPWGSLQVANQPIPGTGPGSFASPPSSFTRAAPALMSST